MVRDCSRLSRRPKHDHEAQKSIYRFLRTFFSESRDLIDPLSYRYLRPISGKLIGRKIIRQGEAVYVIISG